MKLFIAIILITVFLWIFCRQFFDFLGGVFGKIFGIEFKDKKEEKK